MSDADAPGVTGGLVRIAVAAVAGGLLGGIGALLFAGFTVLTGWFVGLVAIVPAFGAGLGVAVGGVGRWNRWAGAFVGVIVGLVAMFVGYSLIGAWIPPGATYDGGILDAIAVLVGIYISGQMGMGADGPDEEEVEAELDEEEVETEPDEEEVEAESATAAE